MWEDAALAPATPRSGLRVLAGRLFERTAEDNLATSGGASILRARLERPRRTGWRWATSEPGGRPNGRPSYESRLRERLPYDDASFDVVVSNQVIEHLVDTDAFVAEMARVLTPGGIAVISTENLASWHNVAALVAGWQPFSLTNVTTTVAGLGNPLAIHRNEPAVSLRSWQHRQVFAYRGLRELVEAHGLRVARVLGAGYYPLPAWIGAREPRHAAFITVVAHRDAPPARDRDMTPST